MFHPLPDELQQGKGWQVREPAAKLWFYWALLIFIYSLTLIGKLLNMKHYSKVSSYYQTMVVEDRKKNLIHLVIALQ